MTRQHKVRRPADVAPEPERMEMAPETPSLSSESAIRRETEFAARLCDVFPGVCAIQLLSCVLRARYRNRDGEPEFLESGRIYKVEIEMWATANRCKAGHRLRLDISSADFPKFSRNTSCGGERGPPIPALNTVYHDPEHPAHLLVPVLRSHSTCG